jgi:hypothetical protein
VIVLGCEQVRESDADRNTVRKRKREQERWRHEARERVCGKREVDERQSNDEDGKNEKMELQE